MTRRIVLGLVIALVLVGGGSGSRSPAAGCSTTRPGRHRSPARSRTCARRVETAPSTSTRRGQRVDQRVRERTARLPAAHRCDGRAHLLRPPPDVGRARGAQDDVAALPHRARAGVCARRPRCTGSSASPTVRPTRVPARCWRPRAPHTAAGRRARSETGEIHAIGREQVSVAGHSIPALHVRTVGKVAGGDSGTETTDWWLHPAPACPSGSRSRARRAVRSRSAAPTTVSAPTSDSCRPARAADRTRGVRAVRGEPALFPRPLRRPWRVFEHGGGAIPYLEAKRAVVAWTDPLCPEEALQEILDRFVREVGRRVCLVAVSEATTRAALAAGSPR